MDLCATAAPAVDEQTAATSDLAGAPARIWHRLVLCVPPQVVEEVGAGCFELGSCGVQVEEVGPFVRLRAYFGGDRDARRLSRELARLLPSRGLTGRVIQIEAEVEPERDWSRNWRRFYRPVWATDRIVIHPPWIAVEPPAGRLAIAIDPAMAFGTGGHASTRLALRALQATGVRGRSCLDLGTGSGVLAIAAARLGARQVTAVDTDPVAVRNARHNVRANLGPDSGRVRVVAGSVGALAGERFDAVVANLESHLVRPLLPDVAAALEAVGGVALFSGLLTREQARFSGWLEAAGFAVEATWREGSWLGLRARTGPR